jgi:hypothetical protein
MVVSTQEPSAILLVATGLTAIFGVERVEDPLDLAFDSSLKASGTGVAHVQQSVASC